MNIGEAIKGERLKRKMTQTELAELLKVTPQAVSRWEVHIVKDTIPKTHAYKYNYNDSCMDQSVLAGAILRMCIHGTFYVDLRVEKRGF